MNRIVITVVILFFSFLAHSSSRAEVGDKGAQSIVRSMYGAYKKLKSYEDTGTFKGTNQTAEFKTSFVRTNRYMFDYKEVGHSMFFTTIEGRVWQNSKGIFHNSNLFETHKHEKLGNALAHTGPSNGSKILGDFFTGNRGGFRLDCASNYKPVKMEKFEGVECYLVEADHCQGGKIEIWIGKSDRLLRKYQWGNSGGPEIHRNIKINHDIPESKFAKHK